MGRAWWGSRAWSKLAIVARATPILLLCCARLCCALLGCAQGEPASRNTGPKLRPETDAGSATLDDTDSDGLCDVSEAALGTRPDALDTDGDQLPDLIELVSGYDPVLPDSPLAEQVAYLASGRGAELAFEVRFTVEGDGQGLTGAFSSSGTLYRDGDSAADYFKGARAVSADPVDAARGIEAASARFEAVLGKSRLSFTLQFALGDPAPRKCSRAYPFRYAIKADDGTTWTDRDYLLVVGPEGGAGLQADAFCLPASCD